MINSGSSFKFLSTNLQKSKLKYKVLGFLITTIFYSMYDSVIIMAWLNCCEPVWLHYYADTKDALFVWFPLLVFLNYFRLLYVLMILVVWLIVCFNPFSFSLLPHYLLVVAWVGTSTDSFLSPECSLYHSL